MHASLHWPFHFCYALSLRFPHELVHCSLVLLCWCWIFWKTNVILENVGQLNWDKFFRYLFWYSLLKGELHQITFLCLLCFCLDDVLLGMYFTEMLNKLLLMTDLYVLLLTQIHLNCRINWKFLCSSWMAIVW